MTFTPRCRLCCLTKFHFSIILAFVFASKGGGLGGVGGVFGRYVNTGPSRSAFVSAVNPSSTSAMSSSSGNTADECPTLLPSKVMHQDPTLWLYHVETTTSTMDEARKIVESITTTDDTDEGITTPKSFLISASSQSRGRGTTQRNWKSSQRGNALFTIGIPQSAWMVDLKKKNHGSMVPLTLLPLKVGSLVAQQIQQSLEKCMGRDEHQSGSKSAPRVIVKWPNDVLLKQSSSAQSAYEKVAGILIESAKDWFIIGIGINAGYAPDIPKEGADYGRQATCISQYCNAAAAGGGGAVDANNDDVNNEEYWVEVSKKLAVDVAYDLHSWIHSRPDEHSSNSIDEHSGRAILDKWKSFLDWDMELILRDTPKRERVKLTGIMEDGRIIVKEVETGTTRTLVADYFL